MTTSTEDLRLAADFAPATQDVWRKLVDMMMELQRDIQQRKG